MERGYAGAVEMVTWQAVSPGGVRQIADIIMELYNG